MSHLLMLNLLIGSSLINRYSPPYFQGGGQSKLRRWGGYTEVYDLNILLSLFAIAAKSNQKGLDPLKPSRQSLGLGGTQVVLKF